MATDFIIFEAIYYLLSEYLLRSLASGAYSMKRERYMDIKRYETVAFVR